MNEKLYFPPIFKNEKKTKKTHFDKPKRTSPSFFRFRLISGPRNFITARDSPTSARRSARRRFVASKKRRRGGGGIKKEIETKGGDAARVFGARSRWYVIPGGPLIRTNRRRVLGISRRGASSAKKRRRARFFSA